MIMIVAFSIVFFLIGFGLGVTITTLICRELGDDYE